MYKQNGFSLIELMIVVAIVGILSAVALPAYADYITRGKLSEMRALLDGHRVKMEQYFQDNRTYVGACASALAIPPTSDNWTITCPVEGAATYTLLATASGTGPAGFSFNVNQGNVKTTVSVGTGWDMPGGNCWVMKKGGVC
ncbi:MAG TPA: prepilin-type N-terminal cleavage/methylation domain-containing protein [Burkholderiales bacterium]|nr:prepilin-type N-terminal cleavage/methylation domain-containing protein [Burkholderiales bacterium]